MSILCCLKKLGNSFSAMTLKEEAETLEMRSVLRVYANG